jgi:hypothetical protein
LKKNKVWVDCSDCNKIHFHFAPCLSKYDERRWKEGYPYVDRDANLKHLETILIEYIKIGLKHKENIEKYLDEKQ